MEKSNVRWYIRNPQHRQQQGGLVLAVAVLPGKSFARGIRNHGRSAKLDSGIADFPVQVRKNRGCFLVTSTFARDQLADERLQVRIRYLLVDDLSIFLGHLAPRGFTGKKTLG